MTQKLKEFRETNPRIMAGRTQPWKDNPFGTLVYLLFPCRNEFIGTGLVSDLANKTVSTVGDFSAFRLKHYRALQINHAGLCQKQKENNNKNVCFS